MSTRSSASSRPTCERRARSPARDARRAPQARRRDPCCPEPGRVRTSTCQRLSNLCRRLKALAKTTTCASEAPFCGSEPFGLRRGRASPHAGDLRRPRRGRPAKTSTAALRPSSSPTQRRPRRGELRVERLPRSVHRCRASSPASDRCVRPRRQASSPRRRAISMTANSASYRHGAWTGFSQRNPSRVMCGWHRQRQSSVPSPHPRAGGGPPTRLFRGNGNHKAVATCAALKFP